MADHLVRERRRFPRVTVPPAPARIEYTTVVLSLTIGTAGCPAVDAIRENSNAIRPSPATIVENTGVVRGSTTSTAALIPVRPGMERLRGRPLLLAGLAGLGLAVWGGLTLVTVHFVLISADRATGRSGDAVTA